MYNEVMPKTLHATKARHQTWKTAHAGFLTWRHCRVSRVGKTIFFFKFKINASGTGACIHSYTNSSIMKTQRQSTWDYSKFVFARQTGIT